MDSKTFIDINTKGWDALIQSNKPFSNTILPEYGPFLKRNEEEIGLFFPLDNAKILDLGCGEGESLEYLYKKGAAEVWGIDISKEQVNKAKKRFPQFTQNFFVSPMEEKGNLPSCYFDYIISIFSIGYTSDLLKTFINANTYLKENGSFIISWTHPFYYCLGMDNEHVILDKSYFNEEGELITKGPDKIPLAQKNLMLSTLLNTAKEAGFYVDTLLEEETVLKDDVNGYKSSFWRKEKVMNCPSTLIIKLKKIK